MWNMSAGSGLSACRPSDVTRCRASKIYRVSTSGPIGRNASNPYIPDPSRNITIYFPLEPIGVDGEGDPTYDEGEGLICMWWDFYKNIWNETGCYYQPADQYYNASCGCRFMVSTVGAFPAYP